MSQSEAEKKALKEATDQLAKQTATDGQEAEAAKDKRAEAERDVIEEQSNKRD